MPVDFESLWTGEFPGTGTGARDLNLMCHHCAGDADKTG